jgi:hypothetical protein
MPGAYDEGKMGFVDIGWRGDFVGRGGWFRRCGRREDFSLIIVY